MPRTTATPRRRGIWASRNRQSCVWHPTVDSSEPCSMRAAGPARTRFTSLHWDCGFWVEFAVADAFQLESLECTFRTVLDSGLFHTFDGDERPK
jgi:hypothetical protein